MDFSLNDHQKLIRDTVRQFMEAEVRPFVKEWEKSENFPAQAIKKLGEMGCCGMLVPEEWGGPGLDTVSYVLMLEEVARVFTAMSTAISVTNSAVQAPLMLFGTDAQKKKYLRSMATGETMGAFCLTEPAAGSDAAGIQARAIRDGNVYKLNGTKTWVTNGSAAGVLIVFAKTDPAAGGKGISAFLVEPGFAGLHVGRHEDKMGQRSSPSVEILLNECVVPVENRLGEGGQGLKIALSALDGGRIGIAAQAVGLAQGALEETVKYAKQRKAFGKNISEFQAIQWMIADMQTEIEAARGLVYYAAWLKDAHPTQAGASASKAKLYASEMVNRVVYKAVQVHGSVGYSRESDVERMYRDARVITIYEGTSEVQRMIIARDLLEKSGKAQEVTQALADPAKR
ncbi:MAG TPA: acyl-CoA dehydrogenase family protein [Candidatus Limnocylindria bacterium]|jgi:alkylation response protein AidB-like acyl-CoA dehydrogenase|nr:acyl-CoA dehydrogenase family protein [Candidatus Limnocylindria bacterium]